MDILFSLFLFFAPPVEKPPTESACDSYVIGFRGLNRAFDQRAFDRYADWRGSCSLVYDYTEVAEAVSFVDHIQEPYELYGYSAGAVTIGQILPRVSRLPEYVITVGALSSVNVDFSRYGIRFDNYFDASGRQQRSPGRYIPGVAHDRIQAYVNRFYK
jgi:hypothetical protein